MRGEPALLEIEGRGEHQDMRIRRAREVRQTELRAKEGAAGIDVVHQVEPAHVGCCRAAEADRAGVVDDNVDAAELPYSALDRARHLTLIANVRCQRQRPAAGGFDLGSGGEDRSGQFRVRLGGLRRDGDVGAVSGRPERNGKSNAPAGAGDEKRTTREGPVCAIGSHVTSLPRIRRCGQRGMVAGEGDVSVVG